MQQNQFELKVCFKYPKIISLEAYDRIKLSTLKVNFRVLQFKVI